jgi:hypothetical protein
MTLTTEGDETVLEAISRITMGRISIQLNESHDSLFIGDEHAHEILKLDQDQALELIENLTELASHMEEAE